jgi:hypothetical protein
VNPDQGFDNGKDVIHTVMDAIVGRRREKEKERPAAKSPGYGGKSEKERARKRMAKQSRKINQRHNKKKRRK